MTLFGCQNLKWVLLSFRNDFAANCGRILNIHLHDKHNCLFSPLLLIVGQMSPLRAFYQSSPLASVSRLSAKAPIFKFFKLDNPHM